MRIGCTGTTRSTFSASGRLPARRGIPPIRRHHEAADSADQADVGDIGLANLIEGHPKRPLLGRLGPGPA